jgi:hypothetical protein
VTLTKSFKPKNCKNLLQKEKEKEKRKRKTYPLLVGSEVSGTELGRADYDPIPHNYSWVQ